MDHELKESDVIPLAEGQWSIAIVDDEPFNCVALEAILEDHPQITILTYESGAEFFEAIEESGPPDVLLLDIMMPKMNGFEVCQRLRKKHNIQSLPVIFITARTDDKTMLRAHQSGGTDFLSKPVEAVVMLSKIARATEQVKLYRDKILESEKMRTELLQREKLSALGTLLAGVAHELNNPAHYVSIAIANANYQFDQLREEFFAAIDANEGDPEYELFKEHFVRIAEQLNIVDEGSHRISSTVSELKLFSRNDDNVLVEANPVEGLRATVRLLKGTAERIEVIDNCDVAPDLMCMPSKLKQVYMNLLVNACQALHEAMNVPGYCRAARIWLNSAIEDEKWLVISISDNGPGMDDELLENVFEPFITTKKTGEGTGLGLSISQDIMERHQGKIELTSTVNKGSEFKLYIPLKYQPEETTLS